MEVYVLYHEVFLVLGFFFLVEYRFLGPLESDDDRIVFGRRYKQEQVIDSDDCDTKTGEVRPTLVPLSFILLFLMIFFLVSSVFPNVLNILV